MRAPFAPTLFLRPIVDRNTNVLFNAQGQPQGLSLRIEFEMNYTSVHSCSGDRSRSATLLSLTRHFPCQGNFLAVALAPTYISRPIVDRNTNVLFNALGQPQGLSLRAQGNVYISFNRRGGTAYAQTPSIPLLGGRNPCGLPLHRRCFFVRLSIGIQTFYSTPKDSRKGCPYELNLK